MHRAAVVFGLGLAWPALALAQGDCFPGSNSNEARALATFAVPLAFSRGGAPERYPGFRLGIEAASLPNVDDATATPTTCRPGKGPENTDLLPGLLRPRIGLPLPFGLVLEASWVPPIGVNQVKANLFGLAVEKAFGQPEGLTAAVRAHATFGSIHAPITCDQDALQDPDSECFGGTQSDDRVHPAILGLDLAIGGPILGGRLRPYGGVGYNHLRPRFQVHFINQFGELDNRRVSVNLNRVVMFGGATWRATDRLGISGELYGSLTDAFTARLVMRTAVGP
jgi:hypothetical protein